MTTEVVVDGVLAAGFELLLARIDDLTIDYPSAPQPRRTHRAQLCAQLLHVARGPRRVAAHGLAACRSKPGVSQQQEASGKRGSKQQASSRRQASGAGSRDGARPRSRRRSSARSR